MEETIIEIIYLSLTNVVPSTVAILVPLAGAFWIFKVREKTVTEGKIFELGREIGNILQSKNILGPIDAISYSYIDNARHKIAEKNREKALKQLLRTYLHYPMHDEEPLEVNLREAATIVVAVATERLQSLVPPTVNWSGKGCVHSSYGEEIGTKDSYFPFGTKLYRQWIEKFGDIYNDLWAITTSRRFFIENYLKGCEYNRIDIDRKFIENWLDEIDSRIKEIHPIHAKLLTQVQIIDTQIDLPRLRNDIGLVSLYGLLLTTTGFFAPKIIYMSGLVSIPILLLLTLSTILSYLLIGIRIISTAKPIKEKNIQRKIFLPRLSDELNSMKKRCMGYKPFVINDILSLGSDLKLSARLRKNLSTLVDNIETFNDYASILYRKTSELIDPIKRGFTTTKVNQQRISINILDLVSEDFYLEDIKLRIMGDNYNFIFSYEEIQSSRDIFTINLSELSENKRLELCECLEHIRKTIQTISIYKTTMLALSELQESRERSLVELDKLYK